jgi:Patatin-like phospholipase
MLDSDQVIDYEEQFIAVHKAEIEVINAWRKANGRDELSLGSDDAISRKAAAENQPRMPIQGTGVAISGGGIRSAAFSLGALQALDQDLAPGTRNMQRPDPENDKESGMRRVDYLSTVSGGGYIGSSLRVGMDAGGGKFPFSSEMNDRRDNFAVGHIRNHSRYLIPNGLSDVIANLTVIFRGLAANLLMVMGFILVAAGMTGIFNPNQAAYSKADILGFEGWPYKPLIEGFGAFAYTKILFLIGFLILIAWALCRSSSGNFCYKIKSLCFWPYRYLYHVNFLKWKDLDSSKDQYEFTGIMYKLVYLNTIFICIAFFLESQPFALQALFQVYGGGQANTWQGVVTSWVSYLTPYVAPFAAIGAFVSRYFGDALKSNATDSTYATLAKALAAKASMLFVALMLPLVLWIVYLHITLATDIGFAYRPAWLAEIVTGLCGAKDISLLYAAEVAQPVGYFARFLSVMIELLTGVKYDFSTALHPDYTQACQQPKTLIGWLFLGIGLALFAITCLFSENANSLHRLYRDRLSKAFLFDSNEQNKDKRTGDPAEKGDIKLGELQPATGPLHLINTALNVQGSKAVNRRGRNADFFFFSSAYCGSDSTGYVPTAANQAILKLPDVGTAMAISGAAASSNMGGNTVWGMAPTLALLNIRLGHWMDNPGRLKTSEKSRWENIVGKLRLYLLQEMFSQLDERADKVYLTDGGHIENLGLYELLRRRCKTILVIDAEADPTMTFGSLMTVQRFARLDLGVRIDLPWQEIQQAAIAVNKAAAANDPFDRAKGETLPHVAVGTIDYGDGKGTLIYVKSSMTGDENDYVAAYKRGNLAFPHESTGDQFFSEEQFEAYRALGFHALHSAFTGNAVVAGLTPPLVAPRVTPVTSPEKQSIKTVAPSAPAAVPTPATPVVRSSAQKLSDAATFKAFLA